MSRTDARKEFDYIDFDTSLVINGQEGRLYWNTDEGTLNLGMPGGNVMLQIGQESIIKVKNTTGSQIDNGTPVYINGADGANPTVAVADASNPDNNRKVLAVSTEDISSNQFGYVTTFGLVRELDTSGCTAGDELFVDIGGGITNVQPVLPNGISRIGFCTRVSTTEGSIFVNTENKSVKEILTDSGDLIIKTEANKTLVLEQVVYNDNNIGGASLGGPPGLRPDTVQFVDNTGTATGIYTLGLGVGEVISGSLEFLHGYKEGSNYQFHIHWQGITAPTGTDKVQFQLTYTIAQREHIMTTLMPTTTITVETSIDTQYGTYFSGFAEIDGTGIQIGDQFLFSIERIAATSDEYAGDALLQTVGIHYQIDTIGSRQRATK